MTVNRVGGEGQWGGDGGGRGWGAEEGGESDVEGWRRRRRMVGRCTLAHGGVEGESV